MAIRDFISFIYWINGIRNQKKRENLARDFLGPSIDAGFRLATLATPRKMILSVEVAYLLASAKMPTSSEILKFFDWPKIYYDGRRDLKGVLGGKPYPVFWIDLHGHDAHAALEDKLTQEKADLKNQDIENFCESLFSAHESVVLKPFIHSEPPDQYGGAPTNYIPHIQHLARTWGAEKKIYEQGMTAIKEIGTVENNIPEELLDMWSAKVAALPLSDD
jgi:hypothetical protein